MHFDSRMETMHGTLNLLLPRGSDCGKISTQPTFLWWGGTIKSHFEPSRDCKGDGPEPEWFAPLGRSQWPWICGHWRHHEGEGSYWCQWFGTADVLITSLRAEQFQHSMLQWVLTSVADCQPWLDPVCWKKMENSRFWLWKSGRSTTGLFASAAIHIWLDRLLGMP